jgi:hypothetical protein
MGKNLKQLGISCFVKILKEVEMYELKKWKKE